jgi:hypothetical protein
MSNPIPAGDGGFYTVKPDGNLISAKALPTEKVRVGDEFVTRTKAGWRFASQADVDAVKKHAAALAAKDPKPASGPLAKGG